MLLSLNITEVAARDAYIKGTCKLLRSPEQNLQVSDPSNLPLRNLATCFKLLNNYSTVDHEDGISSRTESRQYVETTVCLLFHSSRDYRLY